MSFKVQQKQLSRSWTDILLEESEYSLRRREAKRERTFRRMYMSVFTLFGAAFLIYCSLFYMGAFVDMGKVVGYSHVERVEKAENLLKTTKLSDKRSLLSVLAQKFDQNRVYLRKGQTIISTYSLPRGTVMTLKVKQCRSMPVVEIFRCQFKGEQKVTVRNRTSGTLKFSVSEPGFYYFETEVVKLPAKSLKNWQDYRVMWLRG